MDHNAIRHMLSEYLDESVGPKERLLIEEHLKTCEQCGNALRELRKTVEHVRQVDDVEPPAWMTQKIMARVREEEAQKMNFFQKIYSALAAGFPAKAIAIVFLATVAFFTYRDITPPITRMAPGEKGAAKVEAPSPGLAKNEYMEKKSLLPKSRVPEEPGYKALDMKPEYEQPAPPVPADKFAASPAPAKPAEQVLTAKKEASEKTASAPTAGAPLATESQSRSSTGTTTNIISLQEAAKTPSTGKALPSFRDYRVAEIYQGMHAPVDFSSHPEAPSRRNELIAAAHKGSNFAGHYTVAQWGCGPACSAFAIMDAVNGKVYFPKTLSRVGWAGWQGKEHGLKFRLESNLLIVYGSPNENMKNGVYYYVWKNNDLMLIRTSVAE